MVTACLFLFLPSELKRVVIEKDWSIAARKKHILHMPILGLVLILWK